MKSILPPSPQRSQGVFDFHQSRGFFACSAGLAVIFWGLTGQELSDGAHCLFQVPPPEVILRGQREFLP